MGDGSVKPAVSEVPDEAAVEVAVDAGAGGWPDEAAETAFRAEARERGEPVVTAVATSEAVVETDTQALPALDELVARVSPEARELLNDLFRAKFTVVRRVPVKALKN